MNWQHLAANSPYKTALSIKQQLQIQNTHEALAGIEELIEALSRSDRRALKSQLIRLMLHIIKWYSQPEKRTYSWLNSIKDAREEIADIQEETPSLNDTVINNLWDKCFVSASRHAQAEMGQESQVTELNWQQVFEDEYHFESDQIN